MLLAIDVGNTNIVYGLFDGNRLVHQFRVESARGRTADEYSVQLRALLDMQGVAPAKVQAAIMACVVPSLIEPMVDLVKQAFDQAAAIIPGLSADTVAGAKKEGNLSLYHLTYNLVGVIGDVYAAVRSNRHS